MSPSDGETEAQRGPTPFSPHPEYSWPLVDFVSPVLSSLLPRDFTYAVPGLVWVGPSRPSQTLSEAQGKLSHRAYT